jgi:hypothetical protein
MIRFFFLICGLFFLNTVFSQDAGWQQVRVDSFLSLSLPAGFKKLDTSFVRNGHTFNTAGYKVTSGFAVMAIMIIQNEVNINPYGPQSGSMKESYEGVKYGFKKRSGEQGFSLNIKDTVLDQVGGFKAEIFTDDHKLELNRIQYLFCVNSLTYSIIAVPLENQVDSCMNEMQKLINSVRFNKKEIVAHASLNSQPVSLFDKSEKLGALLAPVLLIGGVVFFFLYKKKQKAKVV